VRSESGNVIIEPEEPKAPFELLSLIGRGGFGNVYLGEWEGRKVAIKVRGCAHPTGCSTLTRLLNWHDCILVVSVFFGVFV